MENLSITPIQARKAWNNTDNKGKNLLEDLLGKDVFKNKDIRDLIKTVDDAYEATKRPKQDFSFLPEDIRDYFQAQYDAIVITEALNEGWVPDWDNDNEPKWRQWFVMSLSAFAFRDSYYGYSFAYAGCGSRLHFRSEELAIYAAKQFPDVWKKIQLG